MEHTPGPWKCHSGMVWKADETEDGYPIARMERETPKTIPTERDANAHLIAAAPELLEACEDLLQALDNCPGTFNYSPLDEFMAILVVEDRARQAISKAKGE